MTPDLIIPPRPRHVNEHPRFDVCIFPDQSILIPECRYMQNRPAVVSHDCLLYAEQRQACIEHYRTNRTECDYTST